MTTITPCSHEMPKAMLRMIAFASCYVYSPAGAGPVSEQSRLLCSLLKSADASFLRRYAARVRREAATHQPLAEHLDGAWVWAPIPARAPVVNHAHAVAGQLAQALLIAGMGADIWTGLVRQKAVRKSATCPVGKRPTVNTHYESYGILPDLPPPPRVMLIDDVITKGRTLMAAAMRVHDAYPATDIRAFALLRTMGMVHGIDRLIAPCVGSIRWRAGDVHRAP